MKKVTAAWQQINRKIDGLWEISPEEACAPDGKEIEDKGSEGKQSENRKLSKPSDKGA